LFGGFYNGFLICPLEDHLTRIGPDPALSSIQAQHFRMETDFIEGKFDGGIVPNPEGTDSKQGMLGKRIEIGE